MRYRSVWEPAGRYNRLPVFLLGRAEAPVASASAISQFAARCAQVPRVGSLLGPFVKKFLAEDVDMNDKGTE